MHILSEKRHNPRTGREDPYYRIKESYRDEEGRSRHRLMLTVGFVEEDLTQDDIRDIACCLSFDANRYQQDLFGDRKHPIKCIYWGCCRAVLLPA